jgi:2-C-methyl-D-erythritol 4-phosphate cytidylyltransferase
VAAEVRRDCLGHLVTVLRADDDHHAVGAVHVEGGAHAVREHRDAGQGEQHLVAGGTHPPAGPGGEQDDRRAALRDDVEAGEIDVVAIHDGARPLASPGLFRAVIDLAATAGAAVPAVVAGRLNDQDGSLVDDELVAVQTPQAFAARMLLAAYDAAHADGFLGTDTAACLERYADTAIRAVVGERDNLKVTFVEDLRLAEELIAGRSG